MGKKISLHTQYYRERVTVSLSLSRARLSVSLSSFSLSVSYTTKREPRGRRSDETAVGGVCERPSEKRQMGASETFHWLRHNRETYAKICRGWPAWWGMTRKFRLSVPSRSRAYTRVRKDDGLSRRDSQRRGGEKGKRDTMVGERDGVR